MTANPETAILTLATGKPLYLRLAVNLARSFFLWHKNSNLRFLLATDQPDAVPPDVAAQATVIPLKPAQFGTGFSPKLSLDLISPADKTLFIDADCICVRNLDAIFAQFAGRAVSVVGDSISTGERFGDVAAICQHFGLASLPRFNGGVYYFERGDLCQRVFQFARQLEQDYDKLGLVRLRGRPNEEPLISIAMAVHGLGPAQHDGRILADPAVFPGPMRINVLRGEAHLLNPPLPSPLHHSLNPLANAEPALVHFLNYHTSLGPYKQVELSLFLHAVRHWPRRCADFAARVAKLWPFEASETIKSCLRPVYHRILGPRRIALNERV